MSRPTHLDAEGAPHMVDVGEKPVTARRAVAEAVVRLRRDVLATLVDSGGPKGDAFVTARLAGIAAAKRTPDLIPLCHPLPLDAVDVELSADEAAGTVTIRATVRVTARTGVEMEALTAASVAGLTLVDMAKALQRDITVDRIRLLEKSGGRSGDWRATDGAGPESGPPDAAQHEAVVVTCSNRSAAGTRDDTSGPALVTRLHEAGHSVAPEPIVVADDEGVITALLRQLVGAGYRLIVTTGGTGLTPTDVTPAATRAVIDREIPGMAELMRASGMAATPMAALSRGVVGARGRALILNLPGSPKGATESLDAVLPVLRHALDQLAGGDH